MREILDLLHEPVVSFRVEELMRSVLDYSDYRKFLGDYLADAKKERAELSHRYIQTRMGISSSGFIANVIAGKKNLSPASAAKLARVLKLPKPQAHYFECLVLFNQARTVEDRNEYLAKLRGTAARTLSASQLTMFAKWYYVVVRAVLSYYPFRGDYAALASQITPAISPDQAREAVTVLEGLGLVKAKPGGIYELCDAAVTSGDEVKSTDLASFQLTTMDMAKAALNKAPAGSRDISTLTLSVSEATFREIKAEVQLFRKHLSAIACADKLADRVYQVNIQLFPLTRTKG